MGSKQSKLSPYTGVHMENVPWVFYNHQLLTTWQLLCFILDFPGGVHAPEFRHTVRIPLFIFYRNVGLIVFHLLLPFEKKWFSLWNSENCLFVCLTSGSPALWCYWYHHIHYNWTVLAVPSKMTLPALLRIVRLQYKWAGKLTVGKTLSILTCVICST